LDTKPRWITSAAFLLDKNSYMMDALKEYLQSVIEEVSVEN